MAEKATKQLYRASISTGGFIPHEEYLKLESDLLNYLGANCVLIEGAPTSQYKTGAGVTPNRLRIYSFKTYLKEGIGIAVQLLQFVKADKSRIREEGRADITLVSDVKPVDGLVEKIIELGGAGLLKKRY